MSQRSIFFVLELLLLWRHASLQWNTDFLSGGNRTFFRYKKYSLWYYISSLGQISPISVSILPPPLWPCLNTKLLFSIAQNDVAWRHLIKGRLYGCLAGLRCQRLLHARILITCCTHLFARVHWKSTLIYFVNYVLKSWKCLKGFFSSFTFTWVVLEVRTILWLMIVWPLYDPNHLSN